jgi:hypothetical protein
VVTPLCLPTLLTYDWLLLAIVSLVTCKRVKTMQKGEIPKGEIPKGEVPKGEVPKGEVPKGEVPKGEVQRERSQRERSQRESPKGRVTYLKSMHYSQHQHI